MALFAGRWTIILLSRASNTKISPKIASKSSQNYRSALLTGGNFHNRTDFAGISSGSGFRKNPSM
jgi:hypothetical protein